MVKKKCFNFCQKETYCHLKLIDEMLAISGEEWEELTMQHHSFFPEQDCNADLSKQKIIPLQRKDPQSAHPIVWNMSGMLRPP